MLLQLRGLGEENDPGVSVNIFDMLYGPDGFGFPGSGSSTTPEPSPEPSVKTRTPGNNLMQSFQSVMPYLVGAGALYIGLQLLSGGKRAARTFKRARRASQRRAQLKAQLAAL